MTIAIYRRLCPNCYGRIDDIRLSHGLLCERCEDGDLQFPDFCDRLKVKGRMQDFCATEKALSEFKELFLKNQGTFPWNMQISWAKRVLFKESFALIAPTGVGKTTFGINMAVFVGHRSYIIVPTRLLLKNVYEKLQKFDTPLRIIAYTGKKNEKEKIKNGDFDILVSTTNFLAKNAQILPDDFDFVFVDDVDSLLKSGRNIDKVLGLIGVKRKEIEIAEKVIKLKSQLAKNPDNGYLKNRIERLERFLNKNKGKRGVLVVSSATLVPKTKRANLFRELLGFEVGKEISFLRNIDDIAIFPEKPLYEEVASFVKMLKNGVFVYVPAPMGKEGVNSFKEYLAQKGINCVTYEEFDDESKKAFEGGELTCVIGISSSRNPLTRGIDLPFAVKFAIFAGVPKIEFPLKIKTISGLYSVLSLIRPLLGSESRKKIDEVRAFLKRYVFVKPEILSKYKNVQAKFEEGIRLLEELFERENLREKMQKSEDISLVEKEGELYIVVGDSASYIQASGRTSRLYPGGMTHGVAFLIVDDKKAFVSLKKRLSYMGFDVEFKEMKSAEEESEDIKNLVDAVHKERERIKEGSVFSKNLELLKAALMIVESPHKARTIASFFGKPLRRIVMGIPVYEISIGKYVLLIAASKGHVFDLVTKEGKYGVLINGRIIPVYDTIRYCPCGEQTTENICPGCNMGPQEDKIDLVRALRRVGYEVDMVFLATDPDTEGEKISWDLSNVFRVFVKNMRRMEFHEVTRRAILKALENPGDVNQNLVKAQILRRIADRWIGFALSEKLKKYFGESNLSAGRVQTPVLGWVIERTRQSRNKKDVLIAETDTGRFVFELENKAGLPKKPAYLYYRILKKEEREKEAIVPFNTSMMLLESSRRLGFSAPLTMKLAQELFEAGLITYHRTDSIRVSSWGVEVAKEYIEEHFGKEYVAIKTFSKSEGAHECIRPTKPWNTEEIKEIKESWGRFSEIGDKHLKLYDLIFRRFIVSQMRSPLVLSATLKLTIEETDFATEVSCVLDIIRHGYDLVMPLETCRLRGDEGKIEVKKAFLRKIPEVMPYTQGELVDEMRKRGIGRPSTYAKIIDTLLKRKYVVEIKGRLYSTKKGERVYNTLTEYFGELVSEALTREIEALQDKVESGEESYDRVLLRIKKWLYDIEKTPMA